MLYRDGIPDVVQYVDEVRLGEDHILFLGEIYRRFYIIEKRAAVVEDCPRDAPAVLGCETGLQRIDFLELKSFVYLSEIFIVIALGAK